MKKILTGLLLMLSTAAFAQQDAMYSQYMFNTLAINPAYAGSRDILSATALMRSQWVGVEGAPQTETLSFDTPLKNRHIGIGVQAFNDKVGITNIAGGFVSYSYRIFGEKSTLAFGLQAGASHFKADFNSVQLQQADVDQAFLNNINQVLLNFGTGIYYNTDKFYIGASVPHLLNNTLNNHTVVSTNGLIAKQYIHLFVASGYVFRLDDDFKLKPSFLFKGVQGAPVQFDLNANLWIKDRLSIGAQYRTNADVGVLVEAQLNSQVRLGYAYDRSVTKLAGFNSGSHEIMLRYEFGFEKDKVLSPRFF
jgi:type IX secretion system PorP/SprF family membrane protein